MTKVYSLIYQVHTKMISDWSAELNKGSNPSSSVDEANALDEQLTSKRQKLKREKDTLDTLMGAWTQQEQIMSQLEDRVSRIQTLVAELEGKLSICFCYLIYLLGRKLRRGKTSRIDH